MLDSSRGFKCQETLQAAMSQLKKEMIKSHNKWTGKKPAWNFWCQLNQWLLKPKKLFTNMYKKTKQIILNHTHYMIRVLIYDIKV